MKNCFQKNIGNMLTNLIKKNHNEKTFYINRYGMPNNASIWI